MAVLVRNVNDPSYTKGRLMFSGEPIPFRQYKHTDDMLYVESVSMQGNRGVAICQDQNKATRYIPVKEDIKN